MLIEESDLLRCFRFRRSIVSKALANYQVAANGCWDYQGYIATHGYGQLTVSLPGEKLKFRVHRVAYAFCYGDDPGDLLVCHHCDNRRCINPSHLYRGTNRDNVRDMWERGRQHPRDGENNGNSRLTEDLVVNIVEQIKAGRTNKQIAVGVPVSHAQVSLIRLGKTWRGVLERIGYDPGEHRRFKRAS